MRGLWKVMLAIWLVACVACGTWLYRNLSVTTDLTVFLPPSATPVQRVLVGQLRDGVASRLILIALEGAPDTALARASTKLAGRLKTRELFSSVSNGGPGALKKERELLFAHRYVLSPAISPERFSVAGLHSALRESLELLSSPAGAFIRPLLPSDPTGEMRELARLMIPDGAPGRRHGVWFSRDGARALLVAETRAAGFDVEAQRRAIQSIRDAFAAIQPEGGRIVLSGPGVFASQVRSTIEGEAWRLAALAAVLVIAILFAVYRSAVTVAASMLPVATGLLVGVTAVSLGFGEVHGITLGFGAMLIGEAVDYPSYLFTQAAVGERLDATLARIGSTLRLAVLTTVFGALAMALSSFEGLAQLGVLTIMGATAAGLTTRWVLPALAPGVFAPRRARAAPFDLSMLATSGRGARWVVVLLVAAGLAVVVWRHERLWDDDLANLTPVPEAAKLRDRALRNELGAPDVRYIVVARGKNREAALQASEAAAAWLGESVARGLLAGFDVPSRYLPSAKTQAARRAALPDAATLAGNLDTAMRDLPFREGLFAPFLDAVERNRAGPPLEAEALRDSMLSLKVESLLIRDQQGWTVLAPLRGVRAPEALSLAASRAGHQLLDLKGESNRLVNSYRDQSLWLIALGLLCMTVVLAWGLRSAARALRVLVPALAAVVLDVAILLLLGERLSLFNLVALLLVVGMGLNYALFFERPQGDTAEQARTQLSLVVCGATTLAAFGCLSLSETPVLHAIGVTVALGSVLSLLLAAALTGRRGNPV
ncbi:MAG: MMPL family transporter [Betaproteobacteria bacterium]|nr:MMPL family transporter [Betaproteobacteria bacterium]MDH3435490.1 MMPL family transporter [Betaproteobacteria bacterium]